MSNPERPKKAGRNFEQYVRNHLFPDDLYVLIQETTGPAEGVENAEVAAQCPDFKFAIRDSSLQFWLECKYRSNLHNSDLIPVFKEGQLEQYRGFPNLFLLLCTYFNDEQYQFFVPLQELKYDRIYFSVLEPYRLTMDSPVKPSLINRYIV